MLENQSAQNEFNLGPEHRSHHHDHGGAHGLSIRVRTRKLEVVKAGLTFC